MTDENFVTVAKAESLLGIKRSSLYSYVSRYEIRTMKDPKNKKKRLYNYDDIIKLLEKKNSVGAEKIAKNSLMWGEPVLESAITLIHNNMLYYRGYSIATLVEQHTHAEVTSLIWTGDFETTKNFFNGSVPSLQHCNYSLSGLQEYLIQLEKRDLLSVSSKDYAEIGARILISIVQDITQNFQENVTIPEKLAGYFCPHEKHAKELIETALIIIADHELNPSTFVARAVASAGATLFQVLVAGLSSASGYKHGGAVLRIDLMINELRENMAFDKNLRKRLARGDKIVGFGHNLYPEGDIRSKILLKKLASYYRDSKEYLIFKKIMDKCMEITQQGPTIDFALLMMSSVLKTNYEFAQFLFAYGRIVGWIGHVIEEYKENRLIRPRAKYIGKMPID